MVYRFTALFAMFLSFAVLRAAPADAETRELLLAASSIPKKADEKRIIPAFVQAWKDKTGETVIIRSSFAASGAGHRRGA